jgi:MFS family permease
MEGAREKRNVLVLAAAQALFGTVFTILATLIGLVGLATAPEPSLATLPMTAMVIGTALTTVPASLLMQRLGRRPVFVAGAATAMLGAGLGALAVAWSHFLLFLAAAFCFGVYGATAQYYRFAAADAASDATRPRAISRVLSGGIVAAIVGPAIVVASRDLLLPVHFLGSFVALFALSLAAIALTALVDIPVPERAKTPGAVRPLGQLVRQPAFGVAVLAAIVAQGTMTLVMTATPLAMVACAHSVDAAAFVIQWHTLAMYLPAFVAGSLIARIGIVPVTLAGLVLLGGCAAVAMTGVDLAHFGLALVLLGIGWSLAFVGATALVAETYGPAERGKAQGLNDLLVFGAVAVASFASGQVLANAGWKAVNWLVLPMVLAAIAAMVRHGWSRRRGRLGSAAGA